MGYVQFWKMITTSQASFFCAAVSIAFALGRRSVARAECQSSKRSTDRKGAQDEERNVERKCERDPSCKADVSTHRKDVEARSAIYLALCQHLHGTESGPFDEVEHFADEDHSYPHTNLTSDVLVELMRLLQPSFLIEVGSMTGGSALRIADTAVSQCQSATPCLLCIDTFLGDTRMWLDHQPGWRNWLRLGHGFPGLYWQFLANTRRRKNVILPLPIASICGLRAIRRLVLRGVVPRPNFIYLDSAHEYGETLLEIRQAFSLLAPGGVIVGDDLDWPAVEHDLHKFLKEHCETSDHSGAEDAELSSLPNLVFNSNAGHWIIDGAQRQWLLRKTCSAARADADDENLRMELEGEEYGAQPAEYTPLTAADIEAMSLYERGIANIEAGRMSEGSTQLKRAAALSASLASHFGI